MRLSPPPYFALSSVQRTDPPGRRQLAILNAGSTLGRTLPVALAPRLGVYNLLLGALLTSAALIFAIFGATATPGAVVVAVLFGFSSGACKWLIAVLLACPN